MAREYKYKTRFQATARCLAEKEGKLISLASLDDLKQILPDVAGQSDLFPIAGNLFVANYVNGNGDCLGGQDTINLYRTLVNKFIDVEHDRERIIGHIVEAGLSKFDPNFKAGDGSEVLNEDGIDLLQPFNIAIGAVIYRMVAPGIVNKLIDCNDPDSEDYLAGSFSFECCFDDYQIILGSKNLNDESNEIISDEEGLEKYSQYLLANKGSGKLKDGRFVSRLIINTIKEDGSIDPDGIYLAGAALTFNPAAQVRGIVTSFLDIPNNDPDKDEAAASLIKEPIEENTNKISQIKINNVTNNTIMPLKTFTSLSDIYSVNDETAKEYSFANLKHVAQADIAEQIKTAIEKTNVEWSTKVNLEKNAAEAARKDLDDAKAKISDLDTKLKQSQASIEGIQKKQADAEAYNKFNERMNFLNDEYELDEKARKALASRIQGMSDEDFKNFAENEFSVFASDKKKDKDMDKAKAKKADKAKSDDAKDMDDDDDDDDKEDAEAKKAAKADDEDGGDAVGKKQKKDAKASENVKELVSQAIANAVGNRSFPNGVEDVSETFKSKFQNAFGVKQVTAKSSRK